MRIVDVHLTAVGFNVELAQALGIPENFPKKPPRSTSGPLAHIGFCAKKELPASAPANDSQWMNLQATTI
jgi:hypothetical protein